jgi:thymidylate synthase ThyX
MTANARNLEQLLRRTSRHPLMELREFALNLKTQLENKIPSLIRYVDSEETEEEQISPAKIPAEFNGNEVKLLHYDKNPDETVISGLLFESGGFNFEGAFEVVRKWDLEEKTQFLRQCLRGLKVHEAMPRAFETVHFGYQIPISAAAFGQLKRHRLTTQICRPYSPALGFILPESIKSAGLASDFAAMMAKSEAVHREIAKEFPPCASYALTNAHKRLVYFQANARELHHIARLRLDSTAQWDIRQIAANMINEARKVAPLIMALACGKDQFENTTQKFLA